MREIVEIKDQGRVVTSADVTLPVDATGTVRVIVRAESGHVAPGSRSELVDAVLDLPELQPGEHLEATVPLGDSESLLRLRERCDHVTAHAAGCSALVEADLPGLS